MSELSEKAMLIRNRVSFWDARKFDRKISDEIADEKGAEHDVGRYNKQLFRREALRDLVRIKTAAKDYHNSVTLAWDKNLRVLPSSMYFEYMQKMQDFRIQLERAAQELERDYPKWIADAKARLNGMFNQSDYPHQHDIASRFGIQTLVWPMPDSDDFRVALGSAETKRIKRDMAKQLEDQVNKSIGDLWQRVYEAVEKMRDVLGDKDKRISASLVSNLRDIVDLLPKLNVTGDPRLDKMAKTLGASLCKRDVETLRADDHIRAEQAQTADDILATMAGYIGGGK